MFDVGEEETYINSPGILSESDHFLAVPKHQRQRQQLDA